MSLIKISPFPQIQPQPQIIYDLSIINNENEQTFRPNNELSMISSSSQGTFNNNHENVNNNIDSRNNNNAILIKENYYVNEDKNDEQKEDKQKKKQGPCFCKKKKKIQEEKPKNKEENKLDILYKHELYNITNPKQNFKKNKDITYKLSDYLDQIQSNEHYSNPSNSTKNEESMVKKTIQSQPKKTKEKCILF